MTSPNTTLKRATYPGSRPRRPVLIIVVALVLVLVAVVGVGIDVWRRHERRTTSPEQAYPASAVAPTGRLVAAQQSKATRLMATWFAAHGTRPDDQRFAAWLEQTLPGPPPSAVRVDQARALLPLAQARTSAGISAAEWFDAHGADDVWKGYASGLAAHHHNAPASSEMDDLLDFADQVATSLKTKFAAPSPYVLVPGLRTVSQPSTTTQGGSGGDCVCSYPSSHATGSAAGATYLTFFDPHSATTPTYTAVEDQIDYSRLYVAGHIPSDIAAGALLGDMVGQYFLVTRGHEPPPTAVGG